MQGSCTTGVKQLFPCKTHEHELKNGGKEVDETPS